MPTLADIRRQYPQYDRLTDRELADRLYDKFYAGKVPRQQFDQSLGMATGERAAAIERGQQQQQFPPGGWPESVTQPPPDQPMTGGDNARLVSGQFVNGVPLVGPAIFGAAQRLRSVVRGEDLADIQARDEALVQQNPGLATAAQIGGGITGGLGMMAAAPALFGAAPGQSLAARILAGAASGGVVGGADSAIRAPAGEKPSAALTGLLTGVGVGAAAPIVAPLAARGVNSAARAVRGLTPKGQAANRFATLAERDRFLPRLFDQSPPERMVMDSGPAFQTEAQALASKPGKASDILSEAADRRANEAAVMRDWLRQESKQVFDPMVAGAAPVNTGRVITEIDNKLNNVINDEGQRNFLRSLRAQIVRANGDPARLHDIQSALGEDIRGFSRSGSASKTFSGRLWPIRQALTTELDQSIAAGGQFSRGSYLQAQKEYADAIGRIEAIGPRNPSSMAIERGVSAANRKDSAMQTAVKAVKGPGFNIAAPVAYGAFGGPGGIPAAAGLALAIKTGRAGKAAFDRGRNTAMANYLTARPGQPFPSILPPLDPNETRRIIQGLLTAGNLSGAPKLLTK